jgi:hypothetical protein
MIKGDEMNTNQLRAVGVGAAFLIVFLSGFRLNHTGKPYGTLIFGIHKLIGVGVGILLFIIIQQAHQTASLNPSEIVAVVVTALFFLATVTTGSLLSIPMSKPMPEIVAKLNKIFPYFTVASTAITLYVLLNRE